MGELAVVQPVKFICGIIAVNENAAAGARDRLEDVIGPIDAMSAFTPFDCTRYYDEEMGVNLVRQFVSFRDLAHPGELAEIKTKTNLLEKESPLKPTASCRRVNLDPGYVTGAKLVLATTKDFPEFNMGKNGARKPL